jgi:hypothetical protein
MIGLILVVSANCSFLKGGGYISILLETQISKLTRTSLTNTEGTKIILALRINVEIA